MNSYALAIKGTIPCGHTPYIYFPHHHTIGKPIRIIVRNWVGQQQISLGRDITNACNTTTNNYIMDLSLKGAQQEFCLEL